jgi:hypothetical protein
MRSMSWSLAGILASILITPIANYPDCCCSLSGHRQMDCPAITVSNWLMLRPLRDRLVRPQAGVSSKSGASLGAAVVEPLTPDRLADPEPRCLTAG